VVAELITVMPLPSVYAANIVFLGLTMFLFQSLCLAQVIPIVDPLIFRFYGKLTEITELQFLNRIHDITTMSHRCYLPFAKYKL